MNFFDLHCDTPYECYKKGCGFYVNQLAVSGSRGEFFEKWSQVFAVWIKDDAEKPFNLYKDILLDFKQKLNGSPKNLTPYFSVEGGAVLEDHSDRLFTLKEDGVSFLTLCWNGENRICGGTKSDKGLTKFGKEVINKMNRLKIAADLSHLNGKSFYSALEISDFVLATHSNCKAVCNHPRNLTDDMLRLLAEKDGIVGLCFYPEFLSGNVFDSLYENICHLLDLGLENSIALGSDFDGGTMDKSLDNIAKVPALYDFLAAKGLNRPVLDKIFYQNAQNYVAKLI